MRHSPYKDEPDGNDRKTVRRIFLQMAGIYVTLAVIGAAGFAAKSVLAAWPDSAPSNKVDHH